MFLSLRKRGVLMLLKTTLHFRIYKQRHSTCILNLVDSIPAGYATAVLTNWGMYY
jgi:hypothetical protein